MLLNIVPNYPVSCDILKSNLNCKKGSYNDNGHKTTATSQIWQWKRDNRLDMGAEAEAAKAEQNNIRAEASRISVKPKLQNVRASRSKWENLQLIFSAKNAF